MFQRCSTNDAQPDIQPGLRKSAESVKSTLSVEMTPDPIIDALCERLAREHRVHTILLYGSRANGTYTDDSDYDVAAFGPVSEVQRITERIGDAFLDVFIYPESILREPQEDHLQLRDGKILLQQDTRATNFLRALNERIALGPPKLSHSELRARRDWLRKMARRLRRGDVEGNFRRAWLLTASLEDYFVLRGRWYEGPKKSLSWLKANDPAALKLFESALTPGADPEAIDRLVQHVADDA